MKEKSKEILANNRNTWFLFSHFRSYEIGALKEEIGLEEKEFPGAAVFYVGSHNGIQNEVGR